MVLKVFMSSPTGGKKSCWSFKTFFYFYNLLFVFRLAWVHKCQNGRCDFMTHKSAGLNWCWMQDAGPVLNRWKYRPYLTKKTPNKLYSRSTYLLLTELSINCELFKALWKSNNTLSYEFCFLSNFNFKKVKNELLRSTVSPEVQKGFIFLIWCTQITILWALFW